MRITARRLCLLITVFTTLTFGSLVLFKSDSVPTVEAQSCDNEPQGSGESISADISFQGTGQPVTGGGVVPAGTFIDINALATAFGQCIGKAWNCQVSPCVCQATGFVY